MATTYTWTGPTGVAASGTITADWSPNGSPTTGDTAVLTNGGTILLGDSQHNSWTLGNGLLVFAGDSLVNAAAPDLPAAGLITTATGSAAAASSINAFGNFVNAGTILADGAAGSTLTLNVGTTVFSGTTVAGYAYNHGLIQADAGNTLTINILASSELFNTGSIVADGGTVKIEVNPSAIAGGLAPVRSYAMIEAGGTLETAAAYASTVGGNTPNYFFLDETAGNTLKIDNIGSFGGQISGFSTGDTIDLGTSLSVGTVVYSLATNVLSLVNNSGTVASLLLRTGAFADGTFAVNSGTADGIVIGSIVANGTTDTVLTTNLTDPTASGSSGSWHLSGRWTNGIIPGTTDTPLIGEGLTSTFALNTGGTPVTVAGFTVDDPNATVQITSNFTATTDGVGAGFGTLVVEAGNTLSAPSISQSQTTAAMTIAAGAVVDLSGHENVSGLGPVAGSWPPASGGNFAATFSGGTAEIDGSMLAGPPTVAGGGGDTAIAENGNGSTSVTVNGNGTAGDGLVTDTYMLVGSDPDSAGTLTLNGTGASWSDLIDNSDPIQSRGYALIGFNNVSTNTPAGLAAPAPVGAAQVLVENGASLTDQEGAYIADSVDSVANVTVTNGGLWDLSNNSTIIHAGSTVATNTADGFLNVGYAGSGTLSVLNGGSVEVGAAGTYFNSAGTTFTSGGIGVGQSSGASGAIIVSGTSAGVASQLSTAGGMAIGKVGQGLLDITNGGTVNVTAGGISVGTSNNVNSSGTVDVGGGTLASALNFAAVNGLGIANGVSSTGVVNVSDNGAITLLGSGSSGQGYIGIGNGAGSNGQVIVGGTTAAAVINVANGIGVGQLGTGSLTINQLGSVILTGPAGITVGISGATGVMTVNDGVVNEGTGSYGLTVGWDGGTGSVVAQNDAALSLTGINIGQGSVASRGIVTITSGAVVNIGAGINVGGSGTNGTGTMTVSNLGSIVMAGTGSLNIDSTDGTASQMTVAGGAVTFTDPTNFGMSIGNAGAGTLTVSDSGSDAGSIAAAGFIGIADGLGSRGSVIVGGTAVSAVLSDSSGGMTVGSDGAGALTVNSLGTVAMTGTAGINIGFSAAASGVVTVNGGRITEGASSSGINMSNSSGAASMLVENGGTVSLAGNGLNMAAFGPGVAAGNASVTVTGAGSQIQITGTGGINVGGTGTGTLTVSNLGSIVIAGTQSVNVDSTNGTASQMTVAGGALSFTDPTNFGMTVGNAGSGNLTLSDGSGNIGSIAAAGFIGIGNSIGSRGSVTVGGSSVSAVLSDASSAIDVGNGGTGALTVNHLGTVALTGTAGINIGFSSNASGLLTVNGGLVTEASGSGGINMSSSAGAASMLVENAGTVSLAGNGLNIATFNSAAIATVTVKGSNALIQATGTGQINVGGQGLGGLSVETGGTVTSANGVDIAGSLSGSGSSAEVSGSGAKLSVTGGVLTVGGSGFGQLSVSEGGIVTAASLDTGQFIGGDGAINVVGTGASLGVTGALTLGDQGAGGLNITDGAVVTVGSLIVGNGGSAAGDVVIGAGSTLTITSTVVSLGTSGSGVIDIQGGTLSLANGTTLTPGAGGRIVQVGGLIDPATVFDASGGSFGGGGTMEASGTVTDTSVATVSGGAETVLAPLITSGDTVNLSGVWSIKSAGTVILDDNNVDISQTFSFGDGSADVLFIGHQVTLNGSQDPVPISADLINNFDATIQSFFSGDKIEVDTTNAVSFDLSGSVISLVDNIGGATEGTLTFHSAAQASAWKNASGALVDVVQCFAAGTRIGTVDGPVAVEELRVGDRVLTHDGGIEPIVWVGQRRIECARHPRPEAVWPVRVAAGAFAENVPLRDLYLSPDHAVFVGDVLVPVKYLINGATIAQVRRSRVTYYHVELPEHAVILAEHLPVESYLDVGDRENFADHAVVRLVPDFSARLGAASVWETRGAAPLVMAGQELELARSIIRERACPSAPCDTAQNDMAAFPDQPRSRRNARQASI